jgi:carboxymethylenebutenolidase
MGKRITIVATDGHRLGAYRSQPDEVAAGGVVVLPDIHGVNHYLRGLCDRLAEAGFQALAPSLMDREQPDFECGYTPEEERQARQVVRDPDLANMLRDTAAAVEELRPGGPVSLLGFGPGASVAYWAAGVLEGLASVIAYDGAHIKYFADSAPKCPALLHFGAQDVAAPSVDVDRIRRLRPDCAIHVYEGASRGFYCQESANWSQAAAEQAWQLSLDWLRDACG